MKDIKMFKRKKDHFAFLVSAVVHVHREGFQAKMSIHVRGGEEHYIVSDLGFARPCLFITIVFLLRAPLQEDGDWNYKKKWNVKNS